MKRMRDKPKAGVRSIGRPPRPYRAASIIGNSFGAGATEELTTESGQALKQPKRRRR